MLASMGETAIPTLVASLRARAADAVSCARVGSVLREVARGRERTVARYLDEVEDVVPLGLMVDILGESRDRTALYHLKGVIDRLESERIAGVTETGSGLARDMIIAKAHFYLARAGSRVAFDSLKEILADVASGRARLMGEILMAVQEIGGREELLDLVALYGREDGWMKDRIREAFRRLMKKARLSSEDPIFGRLDDRGRAVLAEILSGPEPTAAGSAQPTARRRPRHVDTP